MHESVLHANDVFTKAVSWWDLSISRVISTPNPHISNSPNLNKLKLPLK